MNCEHVWIDFYTGLLWRRGAEPFVDIVCLLSVWVLSFLFSVDWLVYLCSLQHHFYGPLQRKMGGLGFIRQGVWQNLMRAWKAGYQGNMLGEGFVLGGVFVIGAGNQVPHHTQGCASGLSHSWESLIGAVRLKLPTHTGHNHFICYQLLSNQDNMDTNMI